MRLSYSNYRNYLNCPSFYRKIVTKVPPTEKASRYFALYGLMMESFFKTYSNSYRTSQKEFSEGQIERMLSSKWERILAENYVCWSDPWVKESQNQIFSQAQNDVAEILTKFDFWRRSRSEVSFAINLKKSGDAISCRMDFICDNDDGTHDILDGKGTRKMDQNVDMEQLYFYALIYLLKHKRLPRKIGFLFYRYHLIKYIDFNMETIIKFKDKLALVKRAIKADTEFKPKVKLSKQCKWCVYRFACDAWLNQKQANAEKKAVKNRIEALENATGVVTFGPRGAL